MPVAIRVGQVLMPVVDQGGLMAVADLAGRGLVAGVTRSPRCRRYRQPGRW